VSEFVRAVVRLGIIGEPLSLFDPVTLISLETDEEQAEE